MQEGENGFELGKEGRRSNVFWEKAKGGWGANSVFVFPDFKVSEEEESVGYSQV